MKTPVYLLLFASASFLLAQSTVKIEGHVTDQEGRPLEGASVVIDGSGYGAATNSTGYFLIENLFVGTYTIRAQFSGYQDQQFENIQVRKEGTTVVNFKLTEKVFLSETVVVEALRESDIQTQTVHIISQETIEKSSAQTLDDLLEKVPGIIIQSTSAGAIAKYISIRGSATNHVIVVLDGAPLNDLLTGAVDLSQIPLHSIAEIRILKGGQSSIYGSGAIGGVVEMFSRKDLIDKVRIRSSSGSFGAFEIQPSLTGTYAAFSYVLSADYSESDENFPYTYTRLDGTELKAQRINSGFLSKSIFARISYEIDRHKLFLQSNLVQINRGLPGLVYALTPYARVETNNFILQTAYNFQLQDWETHLNLSYRENMSLYENDVPSDAPLAYRSVPSYETKYGVESYSALLSATYKGLSNQEIKTGFSYNKNKLNDHDRSSGTPALIPSASYRQTGILVQHTWHMPHPRILNTVYLNSAMRYDFIYYSHSNSSRSETRLSPSIGLYSNINAPWLLAFRINYNEAFRSPTLADLFYQDYRVQGNPYLRPEDSSELSVGFSAAVSSIELSATYFRQNIINLIHWQLGSFATWRPFNMNAEIRGLEIEFLWKLPENIATLNMSHNYSDVRNRNGETNTDGKILTYRPTHTTKFVFEINLSNWRVNYYRSIIGKRFVTEANTVALPAYALDDVTVAYDLNIYKCKISAMLSVLNIFDKDYELIERGPMPGRTVHAALKFEY